MQTIHDNSIDALIPEIWAMESIAILEENMVAANLIHRDFEMEFARWGDIVNTRKPADLLGKRKTAADDVTIQDVNATNVAVPLNQHVHTSFLIRDGEETKSMKSLIDEFLRPAVVGMSRFVDQVVLGQVYRFIQNQAGAQGALSVSNSVAFMTDARNVLNVNKAPMSDRSIILTPDAETIYLQTPTFHEADRVGDEGTALREASLGRKFGLNTFMAQNTPSIPVDVTLGVGEVNNASGYAKGTTVLTVDGFASGEVLAGDWITISDDATSGTKRVYRVIAVNTAVTTIITLEYGLVAPVVDNSDIEVFDHGAAVNLAAGYIAGFGKEIIIDGVAGGNLSVGQMVSFSRTGGPVDLNRYTVIQTNGTTSMLLDRPLELALVDDDILHFGPHRDFNFAFHRNAVTLVIRPLNIPQDGTGALAAVNANNGITMRAVITYDGVKQGHLVTLDFLMGVQVLDLSLGAVLLT